jgi:hypothetical protein
MDIIARRWMLKTARLNYWRVTPLLDMDDLIQEGFVCYYHVVKRYPHVKDPPQLMRLFQVTYIGAIHDLSKRRTKKIDIPVADAISEASNESQFWETKGPVGLPSTSIFPPSPEVKAILQALSIDANLKKLRSLYRVYKNGRRETLNDRLCRLAGVAPDFDLVGALKNYLHGV